MTPTPTPTPSARFVATHAIKATQLAPTAKLLLRGIRPIEGYSRPTIAPVALNHTPNLPIETVPTSLPGELELN
jgi:hypothetical protein